MITVGKRYGRLLVVEKSVQPGKAKYLCRCDCGTEKIILACSLTSGKTKSCGCKRKEIVADLGRSSSTHGQTDTRLFRIHQGMKQRCNYLKNSEYSNYGGRGIIVCQEWSGVGGFVAFRDWSLENGYSPELTIDRIDTNGDYCPQNCRWSSYFVQENNRRNNRIISYCGKDFSLSVAARLIGISSAVLRYRINNGWPEQDWLLPVDLANGQIRRSV